jgi:hypothetical protein
LGCKKDVPSSDLLEKRADSLIGQVVSIARTVAGFVPKAVQTISPSFQPPVAKQSEPVEGALSDRLVDHALSMVATVSIDEPNMVSRIPWLSEPHRI